MLRIAEDIATIFSPQYPAGNVEVILSYIKTIQICYGCSLHTRNLIYKIRQLLT